MPETSHVIDDGPRVSLLGTQRADIPRLVVRLLRGVLDEILQPYQWNPAMKMFQYIITFIKETNSSIKSVEQILNKLMHV